MKNSFSITIIVLSFFLSPLSTALSLADTPDGVQRIKDADTVGGLIEETGKAVDEGDLKGSSYGIFWMIIIVVVGLLCIKCACEMFT